MDENVEEQNGESEESSNGAALNESGSKRSLRRTTRVKTAKNNMKPVGSLVDCAVCRLPNTAQLPKKSLNPARNNAV